MARAAEEPVAVAVADHRGPHRARTAHAGHHHPRLALDAELLDGRPRRRTRTAGAGVEHRRHLHPRPGDVHRRRVRGVVVGEHHRAVRDPHRVPVGEGLRGRGEHHPRPIVVGEDDRALVGAGREHDLAGPHHPQALTGISGEPFRDRDEVLVVVAERGRPGEDRRPGVLPEPGFHLAQPRDEGPPFGEDTLPERRAADPGAVLDEHGARAGPGGGEGGGEAGRAAPHHQHVAEVVGLVVVVRVRDHRAAPESRRPSDEPLVEEPAGGGGRPHERLVVEAGGKEGGGEPRRRPEVEGEGGPAILAPRRHARLDLDLGGPEVRLRAGALPHGDERVRLLRPRRHHPAGPVVLEAAAEEAHPVREEGRGEGVAPVAEVRAAVEGELDELVAIDEPAREVAEALELHAPSSPEPDPEPVPDPAPDPASASAPDPASAPASGGTTAGSAPSTSWVAVSRITRIQRPHPPW